MILELGWAAGSISNFTPKLHDQDRITVSWHLTVSLFWHGFVSGLSRLRLALWGFMSRGGSLCHFLAWPFLYPAYLKELSVRIAVRHLPIKARLADFKLAADLFTEDAVHVAGI